MPAYFSRKTPFIRLLIFLCAGILVQWYLQPPLIIWWCSIAAGVLLVSLFFFIPLSLRYRLGIASAGGAALVFAGLGALLTSYHDVRNDPAWMGHCLQQKGAAGMLITLQEPLIEKTKSYKADAAIQYLLQDGQKQKVTGRLIIYFKKDSSLLSLGTGSQLLFRKSLQEIKNAGNPGGFDYKRYALFRGITHQVYLQPGEYFVLPEKNTGRLQALLETVRSFVLTTIKKYVPGEKESGLAEALLIGYKNDLDKNLVQSYTNTGVVHIIAISGLHLGLIYWLLRSLFRLLLARRHTRWLRPVLIISGLWFFSLLAGAQPSILRAAVMFTCIVIAESLSRRGSIYNTLACSALLLLCINPYWLWDVGFQLSYVAVLSIVIFMKPVYHLFYFKHKAIDFIWQMNAVTIAAQILTLPVSIYHFHQFPAHFLLSNFVAVPLSSIILVGLIALCAFSIIPIAASWMGAALSALIMLLNKYVEQVELLPAFLWDGLQINGAQVMLLFIVIALLAGWWLGRERRCLPAALFFLLCFAGVRAYSFYQAERQRKIIVYNVPHRQAMDLIGGRRFSFAGDTLLMQDDFARNFHLKPSRILHRTGLDGSYIGKEGRYIDFGGTKIIRLDTAIRFNSDEPVSADLLILSGNPRLYIKQLLKNITPAQVIIDGSVPAWKARYWKQDCAALKIPCHDVSEKGAFVMNLR